MLMPQPKIQNSAVSDEPLFSSVSPNRVLLIAPQPFFLERGTPINVRAIAQGLSRTGLEVDLLAFPYGDDVALPGVRLLRSPKVPGIRSVPIGPSWRKIVLDFFLFFTALRLVFKNRYAVIHGVEEGGCIAGILGRLRGIPYVYDMDSCMPSQLEQSQFVRVRWLLRFVNRIEDYFIRNASAVLTVCESLTLKARNVIDQIPIYQLEDFPLESSTEIDEKLLSQLRLEFGLNQSNVILYTGNFESYQGIDLLLESFAEYRKRVEADASTVLVLVGGGKAGDALFEKYREKAKQLGFADSVRFVGNRPSEQMGTFMALADVLVSPRIDGENTPLKVYTYMAAERPVVATDIRSHTQVLSTSTAFLSPAEPGAFAAALTDALEQSPRGRSRARERAAKAKALVDTRFSRREFERGLQNLYAEVFASKEMI